MTYTVINEAKQERVTTTTYYDTSLELSVDKKQTSTNAFFLRQKPRTVTDCLLFLTRDLTFRSLRSAIALCVLERCMSASFEMYLNVRRKRFYLECIRWRKNLISEEIGLNLTDELSILFMDKGLEFINFYLVWIIMKILSFLISSTIKYLWWFSC